MRPRRLIPRYSLRTLVVFMLLVTSGVGLWWRARGEPWYCEHVLEVDGGGVGEFATFSPDGARLLLGGYPATVWDPESGALVHVLRRHAVEAQWGIYSPDGGRILTGSAFEFRVDETAPMSNDPARVWQAKNGQLIAALDHGSGLVPLGIFSSDGTRIVSSARCGTAKVWDGITGRFLADLRSEFGSFALSAAFSPDGRSVYTPEGHGDLVEWEAQTGKRLRTFAGRTTDSPYWIIASPDGDRIATSGHRDGTVVIWDARRGVRQRILDARGHDTYSFAFSRDSRRLLATYWNGPVWIWDAASGEVLTEIDLGPEQIWFASFCPDEKRMAATSSEGKMLQIWSIPRKQLLWTTHVADDAYFGTFSPDGERLVTGGSESRCLVWRRRRPEWWWGVFWLREFWLTAAFAAIFVWSVVRDRRRLARTG